MNKSSKFHGSDDLFNYAQGVSQEAWTNAKFKWSCVQCARNEDAAHGMQEGSVSTENKHKEEDDIE